MRQDIKREHRETKRLVKRAGHKHVRNTVKRVLTEDPDEAAHLEDDFGKHRSVEMNGIDNDLKRKRIVREVDADDES